MLSGLDVVQIHDEIIKSPEIWLNAFSVMGSMKQIYQLNNTLALVCIEDGAKGISVLKKEISLLAHIRDMGLPTINFYGDIFSPISRKCGILTDWISDAYLIDSKDQDACVQKMISIILNMVIPAGEAWVLKKNEIENKIQSKIRASGFNWMENKAIIKILHHNFSYILNILEQRKYMIGDLQLLIKSDGSIKIIDPIDVVKVKSVSLNKFTYTSVYDDSSQLNSSFIQQLYDGRKMLNTCLRWCEQALRINSNEELMGFLIKKPLSNVNLNLHSSHSSSNHSSDLRKKVLFKTIKPFCSAPCIIPSVKFKEKEKEKEKENSPLLLNSPPLNFSSIKEGNAPSELELDESLEGKAEEIVFKKMKFNFSS